MCINASIVCNASILCNVCVMQLLLVMDAGDDGNVCDEGIIVFVMSVLPVMQILLVKNAGDDVMKVLCVMPVYIQCQHCV